MLDTIKKDDDKDSYSFYPDRHISVSHLNAHITASLWFDDLTLSLYGYASVEVFFKKVKLDKSIAETILQQVCCQRCQAFKVCAWPQRIVHKRLQNKCNAPISCTCVLRFPISKLTGERKYLKHVWNLGNIRQRRSRA